MSFISALIKGRDPRAVVRDARAALAQVPVGANFGILYVSDHLADDLSGILEALRLHTAVEHWVGGVAVGVFSDAGECFDEPAIAVLVGCMDERSFRVLETRDSARDVPDANEQQWIRNNAPTLCLIHADPRSSEVEARIRNLGRDGFVVGGLLSSRSRYLHVADGSAESVISGAVFSGDVAVATGLSQGCEPIGERHSVTRVDGQLLLELDHKPAVQVLREDVLLGGSGMDAGALHIALIVPGDDGRNYLVRNLLGIDPDAGSLAVAGEFALGSSVMFCRRDAASARNDLRTMLDGLSARLHGAPKAAVYVSCLARGPNLFPEPDTETALIRSVFPDLPLVGFFANGEFSRDRVYAYTGVLTVFL